MYMIRNIFRAQRGKAPELIAIFTAMNQVVMAQEGFSQGKIYADMTGPMDTVIWAFEAQSLDRFYQFELGVFVNPDAQTQQIIDNLNGWSCPCSLRLNTRGRPSDRHWGNKVYSIAPSWHLRGPLPSGDALAAGC